MKTVITLPWKKDTRKRLSLQAALFLESYVLQDAEETRGRDNFKQGFYIELTLLVRVQDHVIDIGLNLQHPRERNNGEKELNRLETKKDLLVMSRKNVTHERICLQPHLAPSYLLFLSIRCFI